MDHIKNMPPSNELRLTELAGKLVMLMAADFCATDRAANAMFIGCVKSHKPVTSSTISRWVRTLRQASGIDVSTFKSHLTRAASTSAATSLGVSVKDIMKMANWTSESTFKRFYLKPILYIEFIVSQGSVRPEVRLEFY